MLEIRENFLPPSLHVYPRKKGKGSQKHYLQEDKTGSTEEENRKTPNSKIVDPDAKRKGENGSVKPGETTPLASQNFKRPLSPYPNYPDFKPPASHLHQSLKNEIVPCHVGIALNLVGAVLYESLKAALNHLLVCCLHQLVAATQLIKKGWKNRKALLETVMVLTLVFARTIPWVYLEIGK
ncbi:hypothetical protein ACLOJK_007583 [Asimina triloba]